MITIIFAPPRTGKTALMSKFISDEMFNTERIRNCNTEIERLNKGGFNLSYPGYITATNYYLEGHKFRYSARYAQRINPYRIGFFNADVLTHHLPPYCVIGIMEGQKYFNSRMFKRYPDWQSRFYEMHGHNYYDVFIDTQRPNLIDINIRELAQFIEVLSMDIDEEYIYWQVRYIRSNFELEQYLSSGKRDDTLYEEDVIVGDVRVLDWYDTRESKPLFYNGRFRCDYQSLVTSRTAINVDSFKSYCNTYSDELPAGFYKDR